MNDEQTATLAAPTTVTSPESSPEATEAKVGTKDLVNLLNFVNFRGGVVYVNTLNPTTGQMLTFMATLLPVQDRTLRCRWLVSLPTQEQLDALVFQELRLSDGFSLMTIEAQVVSLGPEFGVFLLPSYGIEKSTRKVKRFRGLAIEAELLQNGFRLVGNLKDFNAVSFQLTCGASPGGRFRGVNDHQPVFVVLRNGEQILYTGECQVVRSVRETTGLTLVLSPLRSNVPRHRPKSFRSVRQVLTPPPQVTFLHPLTGNRVSLQVADLSGVGLATEEFVENSLLLPGLILPELIVELGTQELLRTRGQVVYRNTFFHPGGKDVARCGVVFLDLPMDAQVRLASLIHRGMDSRIRVCTPVNMDELWRFFFESGFLYPEKYLAIEDSREEFRKTYESLYLHCPSVTRHFLCEDKGTVFAHMSMVRSYPRAWLIHHHAASRSGYGLAGVAVLDQMNHYINEFHLHDSAHMDFVMCYYRRENKFPHRVFGGAYHDVDDPKGISLDEFAYLHLSDSTPVAPSSSCQVYPSSSADLAELHRFYEKASGGLALEAMGFSLPRRDHSELIAEFHSLGMKRDFHVFSVKEGNRLKAVMTLQLSDIGLNLSNLTHCWHVFVLDENVRSDELFSSLQNLSSHFGEKNLPVLIFPSGYAEHQGLEIDKKYLLWVLGMSHADGCFQSFTNRFRRRHHDGS